jgi:hypothetical protein
MSRVALGLTLFAFGWCASSAMGQLPNTLGAESAKAAAQSGEPLVVTLERKKIVVIGGRESMVSAEVAKPGDVLFELATYTNRTKKPLAGFQATLPVPQNTELVEGTAEPANVLASVDGKNFSPMPLKRKAKQANGVEIEQLVPIVEYRYLRWPQDEIGPEKTVRYSARFRVNQE